MKAKEQKLVVEEINLCKCGCGSVLRNPESNFFRGHWMRMPGRVNPFTLIPKEQRTKNASNAAKVLNSMPGRKEHLVYARSKITKDGKMRFVEAGHKALAVKREDPEWCRNRNQSISKGMIENSTADERSRRAFNGSIGLWDNDASVEKWMKSRFTNPYSGFRYLYNGVYFRSRYEVRFAYILDQLGYVWQYEKLYFPYILNEKKRRYLPDFYVEDLDVYFEVTGYLDFVKVQKMELTSASNNIIVLIVDGEVLDLLGFNNNIIEFDKDSENVKLFHANTGPSQVGNDLEGVETTIENLRQRFSAMISKLHEQSPADISRRYSPNLRETVRAGDKELQVNTNVVYAPYIPLFATPTLVTSDLFAQKGFLSAAGFKIINAGMYTYGTITNLGG